MRFVTILAALVLRRIASLSSEGYSMRTLRLLSLLLLLAIALASAVAPTVQATAEVLQDTRLTLPYENDILNPCTGEVVQLTGQERLTILTRRDAQGGVHSHLEARFEDVTGVGVTSGIQYQLQGVTAAATNFDADAAPLVFPLTIVFNLVSQGGSDNFLVHEIHQIVIAPNGQVVIDIDRVRTECVG